MNIFLMKRNLPFYFLILVITICASCDKKNNSNNNNNNNPVDTTTIPGYSILKKLPGIWNGPVTSSTPLGSYPEWIVDFRPISEAQVSGKSELDTLNDIFMSFFIVQYDNKYQMAFRNGGGFAGLQRVSYMVLDSVAESVSESLYRFSDFKAGRQRVYTDVVFKADSLIITTYTNKYNSVGPVQLHMQWRARLADTTSTQDAIVHFTFPQKKMVRDFSNSFTNLSETVFYNTSQDPYLASEHPYLGNLTVNISFSNSISADPAKKVFLLMTTQPLFNGFVFNASNMKYRSRYVILSADDSSFEFDYMHPGTYYLYSLYDVDGNRTFSSSDYIASNFTSSFSIGAEENKTVSTVIDFQIP